MSVQYDNYIKEHKKNVRDAFNWLDSKELLNYEDYWDMVKLINEHDDSKYEVEEYDAYDRYFYGIVQSHQVQQDFELAFLRHLHRNPHHWQHWILINDGGEEHEEVVFEMPYKYAIEMICDWWSFSWRDGDLYKIFDWYETKKDKMRLNEYTAKFVEDILSKIKELLDLETNKINDLLEHGLYQNYDIASSTWVLKVADPEIVLTDEEKENAISRIKELSFDKIGNYKFVD